MSSRAISPTIARRFGLGYAPANSSSFLSAMRELGFTDWELSDADLMRRGEHGFYATFRDRLMFPIIDVRGDVVGFSGRALGDSGAKYLNSKDTPVFIKGRNLFALNLAKKSKAGYLILSEGNIDIVALHQAGFDSAVASLGTSLTPEQARLISRYTGEVILAYDNDAAGMKASQRAIGILEKLDLKVRVLHLAGAKVPDEYIRARGADAFRSLLEASEDQVDYRLGVIKAKYDLERDDQKVAYLREATAMLATLPGAVERQVYAIRVAGLAGVGQDAVVREVERRRKQLLTKAQRSDENAFNRPERMAQPAARELRYLDPVSAAAEEGVIRLLCLEPALARTEGLPEPQSFTSEALGRIYGILLQRIKAGEGVGVNALSGELSPEEIDLLVRILQKPELLQNAERAMRDYITRISEQGDAGRETDLNALRDRLRERKGYHP